MLMYKSLLRNFFILLVLLLTPAASLCAGERITNFDSWLQVDRDGTLTVIETITVIAEGNQIKRGIYRDFPTDYTNWAGMRVRVGFTVMDVKRDGKNEPYHIDHMGNGVRLYIGDKNVFLKPGSYTYSITYQTDRQIGFFADYDELYWNVTGNDWVFPIEQASATLVLPEGASILQYSTYTGSQGSTDSNAELSRLAGNEIEFRTTAPLGSNEGLTIAAAWPKGIVAEPDIGDKTTSFLHDNLTMLVGSMGLFILFFYYIVVWFKVGIDPESGTIIPRFKPPDNVTPAAARYVMQMGFDDKTYAAALVGMAVKKYLLIEDDGNVFTLAKAETADSGALSRGEKKVANNLFAGRDRLTLKKSNHKTISSSISALEKSLQTDFEALHFKRNRMYMLPGLLITVLLIISMILTAQQKEIAGFMAVWLSLWSGGCYALLYGAYKAWQKVFSGRSTITEKGGALFTTLFGLPFFASWFFGVFALSQAISIISVVVLLVIIVVNIIFYHLLRAPTVHGRKIMDQLEGLKLYLSVAEKERLNLLNPPEKTPALFEKFLPWALALDVEQEWSEQFSDVLASSAEKGDYSPVWYQSHRPFSANAMASSLGSSLASSIASSSTAPGSSSGSGGGGSSGGGGGGGGGGGW